MSEGGHLECEHPQPSYLPPAALATAHCTLDSDALLHSFSVCINCNSFARRKTKEGMEIMFKKRSKALSHVA